MNTKTIYIPFSLYKKIVEFYDSTEGIVHEQIITLGSIDYVNNNKMCYCNIKIVN